MRIIQCASNLCIYNNWHVTSNEVLEKLKKVYHDSDILENKITKCIEDYASLGGCSILKDKNTVFYNFLFDLDSNKKLLMNDGVSFFYAKNKKSLTIYNDLIFQKSGQLIPGQ